MPEMEVRNVLQYMVDVSSSLFLVAVVWVWVCMYVLYRSKVMTVYHKRALEYMCE